MGHQRNRKSDCKCNKRGSNSGAPEIPAFAKPTSTHFQAADRHSAPRSATIRFAIMELSFGQCDCAALRRIQIL